DRPRLGFGPVGQQPQVHQRPVRLPEHGAEVAVDKVVGVAHGLTGVVDVVGPGRLAAGPFGQHLGRPVGIPDDRRAREAVGGIVFAVARHLAQIVDPIRFALEPAQGAQVDAFAVAPEAGVVVAEAAELAAGVAEVVHVPGLAGGCPAPRAHVAHGPVEPDVGQQVAAGALIGVTADVPGVTDPPAA